MNKLKVCIVGCGRISTLQSLAYKNHSDAEIYAVCDLNETRAEEKAAEWGARKIYTDYGEALKDPEIDAVELLVPHHLHCEMTVRACEAGKHVSLQKPMAMSLEEADRMIEAAKKAGVKFKVYENFVFYPPYVKAKELIDKGEIGEPISIRIKLNAGRQDLGWNVEESTWSWRMKEETCGGGPLVFDDGYHKFSIAKYLMGDVEKVFAWIDKTDIIPGVFYEDAPAMIAWKYKDGKKYGFMDVTFSKDLYINTDYYVCDERVEVTGTKGVLWVTRCTAKMLQIPTLIIYKDGCTTTYEGLRDDWADSFIDSTNDFISSVKNNREPRLTGEEGREVLKFALAALESAKLNRQVYLDELEAYKAK
jgi:predicted dehydrogenase